MTGPVKMFFSVQIITKQRSYVQLTAVNNVNGKNIFHRHDHGLSMVEPPLVLVGLLQEWCRIKALVTVNRGKEVRLNFICRGKCCGGANT